MTSELWSAPPQFAQGQYFSASMHGNALVDCCNVILGVYKGPVSTWQTGKMYSGGAASWNEGYGPSANGYRIWSGAVRHKTNADTLAYSVRVWKTAHAQTIKITAGALSATHNIGTGSGYVDTTGSIDVSSVTENTFYEVFVDIDSASQPLAQVLYTYETDVQTYAALAAFTANTLPTAADWSALSTRASTLWQQLTEPTTAVFGAYHTHQTPRRGEYETGRWTFVYNNQYLAYQIRVKAPGNGGASSYQAQIDVNGITVFRKGYYSYQTTYAEGVTTLRVKGGLDDLPSSGEVLRMVNGSELVLLGTKDADGNFTGCTRGYKETPQQELKGDCYVWQEETDGKTWEKQDNYVLYRGVIYLGDLGLSEGTRYEITVTSNSDEHEADIPGDYSGFGVDYLYFVSASTPYTPGWSSMPSFVRGDNVTGAGSVKTIRDNLTWLSDSTRIIYRNHAAPLLNRWGGYSVRQRRWLVYYCTDEDQAPELVYWRNTKEQETVGLTNEPYKWLSYDLEAADGLWDGIGYHIRGVTYAMEDDYSV